MLPKSWLKHGEIFTDDDCRNMFVCTYCLNEKTMFRCYNTIEFWTHIKKIHFNELANAWGAIEKRRRMLMKRNEKSEADVVYIDLIDDDDDDVDDNNGDDNDISMNKTNTNYKESIDLNSENNIDNVVDVDNDFVADVDAVDIDQAEKVSDTKRKRQRKSSSPGLNKIELTENISPSLKKYRRNSNNSNSSSKSSNSSRKITTQVNDYEIKRYEEIENEQCLDPAPIVSDSSDDESDNEEWTHRLSLMLKDKLKEKTQNRVETIEDNQKYDELLSQLHRPIVKYIKSEVPENEIEIEMEQVVDQVIEDVLDNTDIQNDLDNNDMELEINVANAVHEPISPSHLTTTTITTTPSYIYNATVPNPLHRLESETVVQNENEQIQEQLGNLWIHKNQCTICGKQTKSEHGLYMHKLLKHDIPNKESKKFSCQFCKKKYTTQKALNKHKLKKHSFSTPTAMPDHDAIQSLLTAHETAIMYKHCLMMAQKELHGQSVQQQHQQELLQSLESQQQEQQYYRYQ